MLPPVNRLRRVRDFNLLIAHGRTIRGRLFDLKYLPLAKIQDFIPKREDPAEFIKQLKIAMATGLRVDRSAVKRNRLKRQMREVVRLLLKSGGIRPGQYCLLVAKKAAVGEKFAVISQEINWLLGRAGFLR